MATLLRLIVSASTGLTGAIECTFLMSSSSRLPIHDATPTLSISEPYISASIFLITGRFLRSSIARSMSGSMLCGLAGSSICTCLSSPAYKLIVLVPYSAHTRFCRRTKASKRCASLLALEYRDCFQALRRIAAPLVPPIAYESLTATLIPGYRSLATSALQISVASGKPKCSAQ
jgi:hypothetical protein